MSAFPLNLSSLSITAKERLARLDAVGGAFRARLSSPGGSVGSPPSIGVLASSTAPGSSPSPVLGLGSVASSVVTGSGGSGEFLLAGGVTGGLTAFVLTPDLNAVMCCGAVAGGVKFCTLGEQSCSFTTHNRKVEVSPGHVYIAAGRNSAFTFHHAPADALSVDQLGKLLQEQHSQSEWVRLLRGLNQAIAEADGANGRRSGQDPSVLETVTPGRKRKARYELPPGMGPTLTPTREDPRESLQDSFEEELVILSSEDSADLSEEGRLRSISHQWDTVVNLVGKLGAGLRALKVSVGEDLYDLDSKLLALDAALGASPGRFGLEECGSAWDGIALVANQVKEVTKDHIEMQRSISTLTGDLETRITTAVARHEGSRRQQMDDKLGRFEGELNEVSDLVKILAMEQEKVVEAVISMQAQPAVSTASAPEVETLKARLMLIEARLPSTGSGRLGGHTFQTRADVLLYVENNVPSNAFHLFHDVVTLLESLTTSHVERRDVLQEWYQSTKVGVNEAAARHMASFRLVLPSVFGRVKEGSSLSAKHHLPAIRSFKEWNTYDGVSGIKSYINTGMEDLKYQLRQDIDQGFDSAHHHQARLLAMEMHELSQNFVMEMGSWMDSFFHELVTTSEASEEEAWDVVGACIKKVFEVIRVPRAQAANATMEKDAKSQCASYLWALVQSHKVMREFIDARFRNHGAIAPVIVLHIFKTRVTRVAMASSIKRLEGRIAVLEKGKDGKGK